MIIIRMKPSDPRCWAWWPNYENRIVKLSPPLAPDTPNEKLIPFLRDAFVKDSLGHFLLALVDEETGSVKGHLLAWVETMWGTPQIIIHQCITDFDVTAHYAAAADEFDAWIGMVNSFIPEKITNVRWASERGDAWHKRLKRCPEFSRSISILNIPADGLTAAFRRIGNGE